MPPSSLAAAVERERVVRYQDLRPCLNAFVDTRTPGSERKENFTIIGPGVSENPEQHVHIAAAHGFNVGGARQPPQCVNSQHSHLTPEVFIVHTGRWAFRSGEWAKDGETTLGPGDLISLPPRMFRGFENVGAETGFLFAVLGGNDPGRVLWAPYVFDAAESYGLVLLENGMLVDTARGEPVPLGAARMPRTSPAEVAALDRYDSRALEARVARSPSAPVSANACERARGVFETALLGPESSEEGFPAGEVANEHGFAVRRLNVAQGARLPAHRRSEEEVFLMHRGRLTVLIDGIAVTLGEGDVLTVPVLAMRELVGSDEPAIAHVVRGADRPAPPCSY